MSGDIRPPVHRRACRLADGSVNDFERAGSSDAKYPDHGGPVKCAKGTAVGDGLSMKHMPAIYQVISRVIDI